MAEHWMCLFEGRIGAKAQAMFASEEQARHFAERHAHLTTQTGMPLKWNDSNDEAVIEFLGRYRIVRIDED